MENFLMNFQEMQIETTLRFHLTPVSVAMFKGKNNNKYWRGCAKQKPLYTACGNANWYSHYGKQYEITQKAKIRMS
jgi:hypothetical protein